MPTGVLPDSIGPTPSSRRSIQRSRPFCWRLPLCVIAFALCALLPRSLAAQTAGTREYQIKAAFLFNFGQFVTWPAGSLPPAGAPFVICVLGADPFGATLDAIVAGGTIQNRPVRVERHRSVEDVGGCQVLYISDSERRRLDDILTALRDRSILTVGDSEGFVERSGMIRFLVVQNRVRIEVDLGAAERAGLIISSRLLSLAHAVRRGE